MRFECLNLPDRDPTIVLAAISIKCADKTPVIATRGDDKMLGRSFCPVQESTPNRRLNLVPVAERTPGRPAQKQVPWRNVLSVVSTEIAKGGRQARQA